MAGALFGLLEQSYFSRVRGPSGGYFPPSLTDVLKRKILKIKIAKFLLYDFILISL